MDCSIHVLRPPPVMAGAFRCSALPGSGGFACHLYTPSPPFWYSTALSKEIMPWVFFTSNSSKIVVIAHLKPWDPLELRHFTAR